MQLGTPQIFNRHPLSTPSSLSPWPSSHATDHLPPVHTYIRTGANVCGGSPTPNPSSIRARFCRVHRQINGVANTGRYMCPSPPPLVGPVHPLSLSLPALSLSTLSPSTGPLPRAETVDQPSGHTNYPSEASPRLCTG